MELAKGTAEGRVLLRNVSWETYERLIAEREERRIPRFFYDRGVLEIVSPPKEHEAVSRVVALLVELVAAEMDLDVESAGSTTLGHEDLGRGFEPDECFYFGERARRVRGKEDVGLAQGDPPPDLVVEVDLTSSSLDKLPVYARLGVPEIWRYAGYSRRPEILVLVRERSYEASAESRALPPLTSNLLARFIEDGLASRRPAWVREVREWARGGTPRPEPDED